jgi:hypothetical protein
MDFEEIESFMGQLRVNHLFLTDTGGDEEDLADNRQLMTLLCPALTDLRWQPFYNQYDVVEVPLGSNRWYFVMDVDDIAKGFTNEHRFAVIQKLNIAPFEWDDPIP